MVQKYPYPKRQKKNIVVIHPINGARALIILFYHQDTESESREIEIGIAGPIFTQNVFKCSMVHRYPYSTRWEHNIVVFLYIYVARAIFILFCDHLDIESESCEI